MGGREPDQGVRRDRSGVSMEERLSLGFLEKLLRKTLRGQMRVPGNWSPPLMFPPRVTDKLRHPLHSVGNFPTPHQEKNKEKTTNTGGNDSRVLLTAVGGGSSAACDPAPNPPKSRGAQVMIRVILTGAWNQGTEG